MADGSAPVHTNETAPDLSAPLNLGLITDADYRLMIESITDYAIFFLDPSGIVLSWNPGARQLQGYEPHEVIGRHFSIFYPPELLKKNWPQHELEVAAKTGRFEEEGWRLRKDGLRFWSSVVITRLTGPDGKLRGFSKITRDLSGRQKQDELLRASEERFRLIVDGVKDYAIFMLDPGGYIVSWNTGAKANKGYEANEIIGKHFSVFYPPEVAATGFPDTELRVAREVGRFEDEGWRVRKDGSRFWASVIITALFDETGRHRGFAKVTRDLTERRRISTLEDEGRRITTFLAMLGHELRNPLTPISNAVAIMERLGPAADAATLARMSSIIGRQLKQITRLVDDLLDVGRITNGKIHLESKPVKLSDVIDESLEVVKPSADARRHALVFDGTGHEPWITGDRARMIQVVCNLLSNAIKFTPEGGRIEVALREVGGSAEISVRDNGPGIAPPSLPHIFTLFAQGEQEISRPQGGLGLGLTLVQQLVTLHGGEVSAFSKGTPGDGAEFVIRLPRAAAPLEKKKADAAETRKMVLVVDDNLDAAETMCLLVQSLGYATRTASDGPSALEAIKVEQPDLVLLDIGLPGFSGVEVAQRVRREVAHPPPLVAVTGYGQASDRDASMAAGFYAHLTKPVDAQHLEGLLLRLLGRPELPAAIPAPRS
ncbi:PAS domain S-box-containing protein [Variovorax boronicumulans]|uniref:PAS domain-containing hybrid sensor histidine kinase/response regulator n=1 Tax=Variovorax boronicumulans TaxID=436515 RepID=UPI0024749D9F|nr:PAS domain S-box protein [Variovorax boronicumulans]MDH6169172.1 PAS domain S-box-containing protein [Variovorax boronicumulans]